MVTFTLAGGCFWCLDGVYRRIKGVKNVISGYSGGDLPTPTYGQVSMGVTGHAETVQVTFDEAVVPAETILDIFFLIHDPTTKDRQGNDVGTQYRSAMFYADDKQKTMFEDALDRAGKNWEGEIVTEISPLGMFYPAEDYHQDYYDNNPDAGYCANIISPKIAKARESYSKWFKEDK